MKIPTSRILLLITAVAGSIALSSPPSQGATGIVIRASPRVSDDTIQQIVDATEPERVDVGSTQELEREREQKYGAASDRMEKFVVAMNPQLATADFSSKLTVWLPGGPRWTPPGGSRAVVPENGTVSALAVLHLGSYTRNRLALESLNRILQRRILPAGTVLLLPERPIAVRLVLRPEFDDLPRADQLAEKLAGAQGVVSAARSTEPGTLFAGFTSQEDIDALCPSTPDLRPARLLSFQKVAELLSTPRYRIGPMPTIALLDSGISPMDPRIDLLLNEKELPALGTDATNGSDGLDNDGNGFIDDWAGLDVARGQGFPDALHASLLNRNHGSHVAGIASGSVPGHPKLNELDAIPHILMMKIVDRAQYGIAEDWIVEALLYADRRGADIINCSFETELGETLNSTLKTLNRLVVAAAGNGDAYRKGRNISVSGNFPGGSGGPGNTNVLTVLATTEVGKWAPFSNYGPNAVDIAAPGCEIESYAYGAGTIAMTGTSQAAPLVSYAAALLRALGVPIGKIKPRLLSTGDVDPALADKVWSSSVLNTSKAVAIRDDVVETTDGRVFYGNLVQPNSIFAASDRPNLRDFSKIVPSTPGAEGFLFKEDDYGKQLEVIRTNVSLEDPVVIWVDGKREELQPQEIADITLRCCPAVGRRESCCE